MKIASKQPQAIKSNVYVTNEIYEAWYAAPKSLGKIHKRGDYWYTEDGHRHASSRDALNYLISHTTVEVATNVPKGGKIPEAKPQRQAATADRGVKDNTPINQQHPMFQEFLAFLDFKARSKYRDLDKASQKG